MPTVPEHHHAPAPHEDQAEQGAGSDGGVPPVHPVARLRHLHDGQLGRGVAPVGRAQVQSTDFIGQAGEGLLLGRPVGGGVAGVGVSKVHLGGCGGRRERDKGEAEPSEAS